MTGSSGDRMESADPRGSRHQQLLDLRDACEIDWFATEWDAAIATHCAVRCGSVGCSMTKNTRRRDGLSAMELTPMTFLSRLLALVTATRANQETSHSALAPTASHRDRVVPVGEGLALLALGRKLQLVILIPRVEHISKSNSQSLSVRSAPGDRFGREPLVILPRQSR